MHRNNKFCVVGWAMHGSVPVINLVSYWAKYTAIYWTRRIHIVFCVRGSNAPGVLYLPDRTLSGHVTNIAHLGGVT